jgi:NAD(P)-dependent dehydrogenase (short-subunit alcohol dehydrogenase family)
VLRTNVRGTYVTARQAARRWIAAGETRGKRIVTTSSWVGHVPWPELAAYTITKAAIDQLTRVLARELAPYGILANAVAPGIVGAGMALHQWNTEPDYRARAQRAIPLGHLQSPQSVADAVLFLVSDLSSYMTGHVLTVDGGASLYPMD